MDGFAARGRAHGAAAPHGVGRRALLSAAAAFALAGCTTTAAPRTQRTDAVSSSRPGPHPARTAAPAAPTTYPTADDYAGLAPSSWGTDLPGIVSAVPTISGHTTVALTFDACGGPGGSAVDHRLLRLLRHHGVPATLFLNRRWIDANTALARTLAADPLFDLENHGTRHVPLSVTGRAAYGISGTASPTEVIEEIESNRHVLAGLSGETPTWFRAGTAHYDDVAVRIARDRGVRPAGFTVNGDQGATLPGRTVAANLTAAPDGAIVLCHMNQPGGGTSEGLSLALPVMVAAGVRFARLPAAF